MASSGFSAPINYFGAITAVEGLSLQPVSSVENRSCSVAEAVNVWGDTAVADSYGEVMNPSVDYIVTGSCDLSIISLGKTVNHTASGKHYMLTGVTITTQAGQPPTVSLSGVEVESTATDLRLYALSGSLLARSRAQDICGAFTASSYFTQVTTTFSIDPHQATRVGLPKFSDASHARIEVSATLVKPTDSHGSLSLGSNGFVLSSPVTASNPDSDYITHTATAVKFLSGTEPGDRSLSMSPPPSSGDDQR